MLTNPAEMAAYSSCHRPRPHASAGSGAAPWRSLVSATAGPPRGERYWPRARPDRPILPEESIFDDERRRVEALGPEDPRSAGPYRLIARLGAGGMEDRKSVV